MLTNLSNMLTHIHAETLWIHTRSPKLKNIVNILTMNNVHRSLKIEHIYIWREWYYFNAQNVDYDTFKIILCCIDAITQCLSSYQAMSTLSRNERPIDMK